MKGTSNSKLGPWSCREPKRIVQKRKPAAARGSPRGLLAFPEISAPPGGTTVLNKDRLDPYRRGSSRGFGRQSRQHSGPAPASVGTQGGKRVVGHARVLP